MLVQSGVGRVSSELYSDNGPGSFWKLLLEPQPTDGEWWAAALSASSVLPESSRDGVRDLNDLMERTLGEGQFGPMHFRLTIPRRSYYAVKRFLPRSLTRRLRQVHRHVATHGFGLDWPVEPRYTAFVRATLAHLLASRRLDSVRFLHFWPKAQRFALVLTHDVESATGQSLVPCEVGRWWRARRAAEAPASLTGSTVGWARLAASEPGGIHLSIDGPGPAVQAERAEERPWP